MRSRWAYALLLSATTLSLVGCGDDPAASSDAGTSSDTPMATDLPPTTDAADAAATDATATDATAADATAADAIAADATATDATAADATAADVVDPTDVPLDAGAPADAPDPADAPPPMDAPDPTDAGPEDSGVAPVDAGPADAGQPTDTGTAPTDAAMGGFGCMAPQGTIALPGSVAPLMGRTAGGTSMVPAALCQTNASGPEHVYTVQVSTRTGVIFDTDAMSGTTFDTVLSLRTVCTNPSTELSCDDDSGETPATSSRLRAVLDPGTYALIVDGFNGSSGNYTLRTTPFTAASNATCNTPISLPLGDTIEGQSLEGAGAPSRACRTGSLGGQLFYSLTLPPNTTAQVTVTPTGMSPMWTPVLRVLNTCEDTSCLSDAQGGAGTAASTTFANGSPTPLTYILSVASTAVTTGTFRIAATQMSGVAPGATCDNATVLAPGATLMGQDTTTGLGPNTACQSNGRQLYYRVSVPAGQRVTVTATPASSPTRTAIVRVLDSCQATTCVQSAVGASGSPVSTVLLNGGVAPRDYFLSVSSNSLSAPMVFSLGASAATASQPGDTCDTASELTMGMTLSGQDTATAFSPPPTCLSGGAVRYYAVRVPGGQRVTVRATPSSGLTLRLRALNDCSATTCEASTTGSAGAVTPLALSNWGSSERVFYVAVGSSSTTTQGTYSIATEQSPLNVAYTSSPIGNMCDDLSMGTAVQPTSGWSDDSAAPIAALPFPMAFMGTMATHYSVSSNGFMQLWPSSSGSPATDFTNAPLVGSGPASMIAPFWDDLTTISGGGTGVRVATVGMGIDRRFVIGWNNWAAVGASGTNLTFQVKLFETTGAIEFHYCTLDFGTALNSGRVAGNSATVGVQNAMRNAGIALSHNTASISAQLGVRLTPRS